jgi:hypothetical protein
MMIEPPRRQVLIITKPKNLSSFAPLREPLFIQTTHARVRGKTIDQKFSRKGAK